MIQRSFLGIMAVSLFTVVLFAACRKRGDFSLPDNYITFTTTEQGITANEDSIFVTLKLSRNTDRDVPLTINFTPQGLVYGTDFTTKPAAASGALTVIVPSGNNEASFIIKKVPGTLFDGDEKVVFDLYRSESPVLIGADKKYTLVFSELIASNASTMANGGGVTFPNKVFIDLSANRQTGIVRTTWDLGFYTDPADFRVILNSSVAMMAKQIAKNDLTQVTAADTVGFWLDVAYNGLDPQVTQMPYIDYPSGDLTRTAFGLIATNAADNKVFIVNRGAGVGSPAPARGWKKVRVLRNANGGYTVQHADIASATFTTIEVPKDNAYFFKYISFDNGAVNVEPEKTKWDLAWTYFGNVTNFGLGEVPYLFQDFFVQNRNVQVAKVMTATKTFAAFTEADISAQTFSSAQNVIGSDWRVGGGPTTGPSVRTDRFYVLKDAAGNYYKLKFTGLTDGGIRGYPSCDEVLVKKG